MKRPTAVIAKPDFPTLRVTPNSASIRLFYTRLPDTSEQLRWHQCWIRFPQLVDSFGDVVETWLVKHSSIGSWNVADPDKAKDYDGATKSRRKASSLRRPSSPSKTPFTVSVKKRDTTWIEPRFDAEVTYLEVTNNGMLRQPSFKALLRQR